MPKAMRARVHVGQRARLYTRSENSWATHNVALHACYWVSTPVASATAVHRASSKFRSYLGGLPERLWVTSDIQDELCGRLVGRLSLLVAAPDSL